MNLQVCATNDPVPAAALEGGMQELFCIQRSFREEPSPKDIADILNVSLRTLQRKLKENGTNFKAVWDESRHALAVAYLSAPQHSINEITHLMGFSRSSSFTRTFRRWTGLSPTDWRDRSASRYMRSQQRSLAELRASGLSRKWFSPRRKGKAMSTSASEQGFNILLIRCLF